MTIMFYMAYNSARSHEIKNEDPGKYFGEMSH